MASIRHLLQNLRPPFPLLFITCLLLQNLDLCLCLNDQEAMPTMKVKERIGRDPYGKAEREGQHNHPHHHRHCSLSGDEEDLILKEMDDDQRRRLLQITPPDNNPIVKATPPSNPLPPPAASPATSPPPSSQATDKPSLIPLPLPPPPPHPPSPPVSPTTTKNSSKSYTFHIIIGVAVGVFFISAAAIAVFLFRYKKVSIKPWAMGTGGQLHASLITGVPKMKLTELQTACEDFSNIIGSFSDGTIYKGTLSCGAEIALISISLASRDDWSTNLESQFKDKINRLSKVNHLNFLKMMGYCEEDDPFSRMIVFEYAPNGSLFEHLHSQYAEHLDWPTRLRIAMGIAYCLEHMHNLNPKPILHTHLDSSSVYLSIDNAAKISDFVFLNSGSPSKDCSSSRNLLELPPLDLPSNVYCFGALLFEIFTGKHLDSDSLSIGSRPAKEFADPTLKTCREDVLERLLGVIQQCLNPYPSQRPTMREIVGKLKEMTGISPEEAMPRQNPSWWAELEIISTEAS